MELIRGIERMAMDGAPSEYEPLSEREFRVLLLDDEIDGIIQCKLKTLNLDTNLSYVALSYTWGESDDTAAKSVVVLHGQRTLIKKNLADALARLFDLGHFIVWADAISINQADVAERNSQVAIMRNIFEKAREVVVWLENVSDRVDLPASFAKHFCGPESFGVALWRSGVIDEINGDPETLQLLQDVMACDYWNRAWIIQEIAIASEVNILFGRNKVNWSFLESLVDVAYSLETKFLDETYYEFIRSVINTSESRKGSIKLFILRQLRRQRGQSLLTVLNLTVGTKQRDPRDAIYSKLGLAIDSTQILNTLDYSKESRDVYIELVTKHIEIKKRLDIICSVELPHRIAQGTEDLRLPSWVPDWSALVDRQSIFGMIPTTSHKLLFDAGAGAIPALQVFRESDPEVISVHGFIFDKIQDSVPRSAVPGTTVGFEGNRLDDPFMVVTEVCRTLAANHLYTESYTETDSIPDGTMARFVKMMLSYYEEGDINEPSLLQKPSLVQSAEGILDSVADVLVHGSELRDWVLKCRKQDVAANESDVADVGDIARMIYSIQVSSKGRVIAEGRTDRIYLVPDVAQVGDLILVLRGCAMPMVLRKYRSRYTVVGACYAHGIMHGEAMREYLTHSALMQLELV